MNTQISFSQKAIKTLRSTTFVIHLPLITREKERVSECLAESHAYDPIRDSQQDS